MLADTRPAGKGMRLFKRLLYSQVAFRDALMTLLGREQPHLPFRVLADPCSIYINFEIRKNLAAEFAEYINLSDGLSLTPVRCLETDKPSLLLTLNIYEVSGLVRGLRAEWSTYIADSDGVPRYLVLEARSKAGSLDPVNLLTRPDRVDHEVQYGHVRSAVGSEDGGTFRSRIRLDDNHPQAQTAAEWIAANDFIYWRNGVCDRTWYDAGLFDAPVRVIPPEDVQVSDDTHWAQFVKPQPRHVLKYDAELEFMISPWFNV